MAKFKFMYSTHTEARASFLVVLRHATNGRRGLKVLNRAFKWQVEPGRFNVMVGPSSDVLPLQGHFDVVE